MSKGGSTTSQVQIPQYLEDAARRNLARADKIAGIGYTPYFGADVAAMTPMQQAAMQGTNQMASAFGLPSVSDPMAGMPQAQDFGGMQAYSSAPMYEQSLQSLAENRPEQYQAMEGMFNPTGGTSYGGGYGSGYGSGGGYGTDTSGGVSASDVAGTALGAYGAYKALPAVASKVGGLLGLGSGAAGAAASDPVLTAARESLAAGNAGLANFNNIPSLSLPGTGPDSIISSNFGADPNLLGAGFENLGSSLGTGDAVVKTGVPLAASGAAAIPTLNTAGLTITPSISGVSGMGAGTSLSSMTGSGSGLIGSSSAGSVPASLGFKAASKFLPIAGMTALALDGIFSDGAGEATRKRLEKERTDRILAPILQEIEANDPTPQGMTRMEYNLMKNPNKYATKSLTDDELEQQYYNTGLL